MVGVEPLLGVTVRTPPPTVETTRRPTPLVEVITSPAVREMGLLVAAMAEVGDGVKEPTTGEPFAAVLVVASGEEGVAIGATGLTCEVAGSGLLSAEVVAGVVPLAMSCRLTNSGFMSFFVRLARLIMLVARLGSVL